MRGWLAPFFVVVALLLLLAGLYLEEDWRGRRAWHRAKAELAAKGEILDWTHYLPNPTPDDRNMMKVAGMEDTFIKGRTKGISISNTPFRIWNGSNYVRYGEIQLVANRQDALVSLSDLKTNLTARRKVARALLGRELSTPSGFILTQRNPGADPTSLPLFGNGPLNINDFTNKNALFTLPPDKVEQTSSNTVALLMLTGNNWFGADEFLIWSAGQSNLFSMLDQASRRPDCWLPGDYSVPFFWPVPNFVAVRAAAQLLGARAQAYLLLNRPDEAFAELERINHLNRVNESRPLTLVAAMIHSAVTGVQTSVIEQGFAMGAWQDRHYRGFIKSFSGRQLLPDMIESLRSGERAGIVHLVELLSTDEGRKAVNEDASGGLKSFASSIQMLPRGWKQQNLAFFALTMQAQIELFDPKLAIDPDRAQRTGLEIAARLERRSPMRIVAQSGVANVLKAGQTTFKNQTIVNELIIASALELYRQENRSYPKTLPELAPKYLERIPRDLILGQPLRYHRRQNGEYALYSVGWNAVDDVAPLLANPETPMLEIFESKAAADDWIWKGVPENALK